MSLFVSRLTAQFSIRLAFVVWSRLSAIALAAWIVTLSIGDSLVTLALIAALLILLFGGCALLVFGIIDLTKDIKHLIHETSKRKGTHAA